MNFRKVTIILMALFFGLLVTGCNKDTNITQVPSKILLHASNEPISEKKLEKYVGTIEKKVSTKNEVKDWYSMFLDEGTNIYLIKDSENSEIKYAYEKKNEYFILNPRVN